MDILILVIAIKNASLKRKTHLLQQSLRHMENILVTGGAGYIGSHTVLCLLDAGYKVTVFDNLSNASQESLQRLKSITGKNIKLFVGDITCSCDLERCFSSSSFHSVIHFAGLKAVGESVRMPVRYYQNNVHGSLNLIETMQRHGVKNIVFSSSATVYGEPAALPLVETMATAQPTNPYGMSKLVIERILEDVYFSDNEWNIALLRYFNPVGAHESGMIGEDPMGIPNNLMPFISQVASGKLKQLMIFGGDYPTKDGTGVRDYIHVVDLAEGHLKALQYLSSGTGLDCFNLGTGQGTSVLELLNAFENVNSVKIPYEIVERRSGDIATCYADVKKANNVLNWYAKRTIEEMCRDAWHWQSKNPAGYAGD